MDKQPLSDMEIYEAKEEACRLGECTASYHLVQLISEVERLRKQSWIPCTEKKPQTSVPVLIVWSGKVQEVAYRLVGQGFACADGYEWETVCDTGSDSIPEEQVTHWMPLPESPAV